MTCLQSKCKTVSFLVPSTNVVVPVGHVSMYVLALITLYCKPIIKSLYTSAIRATCMYKIRKHKLTV